MRGILLVDHGSRRGEANATLERMGALVAEQVGPSVVVRTAHLELAEPSIEAGLRACAEAGATDVTVQPFMLTAGRHATEDIPRLALAAAGPLGLRVTVAPPLGAHPLLAAVVLERAGFGPSRGG